MGKWMDYDLWRTMLVEEEDLSFLKRYGHPVVSSESMEPTYEVPITSVGPGDDLPLTNPTPKNYPDPTQNRLINGVETRSKRPRKRPKDRRIRW